MKVLLIEDNADHRRQITDALTAAGIEVEPIQTLDREGRANYRALHPGPRIVIADLVLTRDQSNHDDPQGATGVADAQIGLDSIVADLWPSDRGGVFIVYSGYLPKLQIPRADRGFSPHWTFVAKETDVSDDHVLTNTGLLVQRVIEASEAVPPPPAPPHVSAVEWIGLADRYERETHAVTAEAFESLRAALLKDAETINRAATFAASLSELGSAAVGLAAGIYGSVGRFESRADSDVEMSVYFQPADDAASASLRERAVLAWNRLFYYLEQSGRRVEGSKLIDRNAIRVLYRQQGDKSLTDGYMPLIAIPLLGAEGVASPRNRVRAFQTLVELQPIYNAPLLYRTKQRLVLGDQGDGAQDLPLLLESARFERMVLQWLLDTIGNAETRFEETKELLYRGIAALAFRIGVVSAMRFDRLSPDERGWDLLLRRMAEPGPIKVIRFALAVRDELPRPSTELSELVKELDNLVALYVLLTQSFGSLSKTANQEAGALRERAVTCIKSFGSINQLIGRCSEFRPWDRYKWLVDPSLENQLLRWASHSPLPTP